MAVTILNRKNVPIFIGILIPIAIIWFFSSYSLGTGPFAVFSESDDSLIFYDRILRPRPGGFFEGRTATAVYHNVASDPESEYADESAYSNYDRYEWKYGTFRHDVVRVSFLDEVGFSSCADLFSDMRSCQSFDLEKMRTDGCQDFSDMFDGCESAEGIDVASLNLSDGVDFARMFRRCKNLASVDFGGSTLSKGENFNQMFEGCTRLRNATFASEDFSSGMDFSYMFSDCTSLELDCSGWRVDSATDASNFAYKLPNVDEPLWPSTCDTEPFDPELIEKTPEEKLIKVQTDANQGDGVRFDRKWVEYSYYEGYVSLENLVGVKMVWADGKEDVNIFQKYKDKYTYLP